MSVTIPTTRDDRRIAWLTALAISIHIAESVLPSPLPGVKPGLADVVTVIVLIQYGWTTAAWVVLLRVLIGSLLIVIATFLSSTFALSLAGVVASLAMLRLASWLPGRGYGPVGYSLLAALAYMAAQFWTAYGLFIPHDTLLHLFPVLISAGLLFGLVSRVVAGPALKHLPIIGTTSR